MGIGLLFPGQASQFPGMGKDLHDAYPVARRTFEEASEALSLDMAALCFLGTEEVLRMTENTQPAIFTVSVAAFRVLAAETGVRPTCAAGHSLGEYSALVAAGALPLAEAVRVLRSRGKYMQEAVPVGEGAMAAILGLSPPQVEEACRMGAALGVVSPANFNGGGQIVISGEAKAVAAACEAAKAAGAKRASTAAARGVSIRLNNFAARANWRSRAVRAIGSAAAARRYSSWYWLSTERLSARAACSAARAVADASRSSSKTRAPARASSSAATASASSRGRAPQLKRT